MFTTTEVNKFNITRDTDDSITPTEKIGVIIVVCYVLFVPLLYAWKKFSIWKENTKMIANDSTFEIENVEEPQVHWGTLGQINMDPMSIIKRLVQSEVSMRDVKIGQLIQIGRTVRVFKARLVEKGVSKIVALKMLQEGVSDKEYRLMNAKIRFFSTRGLEHPNVVKFMGAIKDDKKYGPCMLFDLCRRSVREWLEDCQAPLNKGTLLQMNEFPLQIAKGMRYLSEQKERMPIQWFAPESLVEMNTYSTESDVWSFGVTVWEIFTLGDLPYINYNNRELINLLKEGFRLRKPIYADSRFYDIMKSCWKMKPSNRPTFSSLVIELTNLRDSPRITE